MPPKSPIPPRGQYLVAQVEYDGNVYYKDRGAILLRVDGGGSTTTCTAVPRSTRRGLLARKGRRGCVRSDPQPPELDEAADLLCEIPLCIDDTLHSLTVSEPKLDDTVAAMRTYLARGPAQNIPVIGLAQGAIWTSSTGQKGQGVRFAP